MCVYSSCGADLVTRKQDFLLKDGIVPIWTVQSSFLNLVLLCELKNSVEITKKPLHNKKNLHKEEILKTLS